MSDIVIWAEGLGKRYYLRKKRTSLKESLNDLVLWPVRKFLGRKALNDNELIQVQNKPFWALRDVSFELRQGDVLGVIGQNGSGKSTLLKVLARITKPTTGRAEIRGRTGVMLEVGSGFHPELTGRENVYMSGSILGMKRAEITEKFDSIVEFAGVEEFIDVPVKFYSSGMYVRLAFSVSAHLETDILLVDEVLAVGDLGFIKKSTEKMQSLAEQGRTVIIVTHLVDLILPFCSSIMLMERGLIAMHGDPTEVVEEYKYRLFGDAQGANPVS